MAAMKRAWEKVVGDQGKNTGGLVIGSPGKWSRWRVPWVAHWRCKSGHDVT